MGKVSVEVLMLVVEKEGHISENISSFWVVGTHEKISGRGLLYIPCDIP